MNGVQTRFKCKLDVKRCKRFVFPPSSLLPRSNALKTKAIRYFQTDRTLTRIVSPPLQAFGGKLVNLSTVFHGVQTIIRLTEPDYIFRGLPQDIAVGRYHSWVVDTEKLPETLAVTAVSPEGQIMALKHREYDVRGIQFHPESVLTPDGKQIMKNWLEE